MTSIVWDNSDTIPLDSKKRVSSLVNVVICKSCGNFKRITEFYNREKTLKVCDDEIMMDIFRFFVERDLMFKATLLTEKELATNIQEEGEVKDNSDINEGNKDTEVIDKMVEDELESQTQS